MDLKSKAVEKAAAAGDMTALRAAQTEWEDAAAEYASTDKGHDHLSGQAEAALAEGDYDTSALLSTVVRKGEAMRAANRETAALIKAVRLSQAAVAAPTSRAVAIPDADDSTPVVPNLTPKQRAEWTQVVEEFDAVTAEVKSIGYSMTGGSYGTLNPAEMKKYLPEIDAVLNDPESDEKDLVKALSRAAMVRGTQIHMPRWIEDGDWSDAGQEARQQRSKVWTEYAERLAACMDAQADRALDHPNVSTLVFEKAAATGVAKAELLTARSDVPMDYLKAVIKSAPTKVHADGWAKVREARFENNSLALLLAAKDPDSFHRNEAFSQVMMMPLDTISAKDRKWLASNLHNMPGGDENQRILAESLKSWSLGYTDEKERWSLGAEMWNSKVPEVAAIGSQLMGHGDSGPPSTGLAQTDPKQKKRRWLS